MTILSAPRWQVLVPLLAVWLPAGTAGWLVTRMLDAGSADASWRFGHWLTGVALALALGAAGMLALPAGRDPVARRAALVGTGWALANATGWFVGVEVGGPMFGLALGLGAVAGVVGTRRAVLAGVGTAAAMVVTGALVGPAWPVAQFVAPTLVGLLVVAVLPGVPTRTVSMITAAFAVAFVGIWAVTSTLVAPVSFGLSVGLEIVLAAAAGAAVLGVTTRAGTGERVSWTIARWTVAASLAVTGGLALALLLRAVVGEGPGGGTLSHLDVGTTVGLGIAAALAVLPTLRRAASDLRRPVAA